MRYEDYFTSPKWHINIKVFQVVLTLFYGQYISNSIFDNFIITIPELINDPTWYYIIKVMMGVIIFITSIFSLFVVWLKHFRLIFLSGIVLLFVFVTTIVLTTVLLTLDYEKKSKSEMGKLIAEVTVESLFQMIGIIATFFMASRREYHNESIELATVPSHSDYSDLPNNMDLQSRRNTNKPPTEFGEKILSLNGQRRPTVRPSIDQRYQDPAYRSQTHLDYVGEEVEENLNEYEPANDDYTINKVEGHLNRHENETFGGSTKPKNMRQFVQRNNDLDLDF